MTQFNRIGHWCTNYNGTTYWRNEHQVHRDDWSSSQPAVWAQPLSRDMFSSYTNPNAKCPVCGASVFFYRSPYGGAVFFDELGPPWPKHPCTISKDASQSLEATKHSVTPSGIIYGTDSSARKYKWYVNGWRPLIHAHILSVTSTHSKIFGYIDKELVTYFFYAYADFLKLLSSPEKPLIQSIDINERIMKISLCWPSMGKSYELVTYLERESIPVPDSTQAAPKVKSLLLQDQIKTVALPAPNTVMKKAMLEAAAKNTSKRHL